MAKRELGAETLREVVQAVPHLLQLSAGKLWTDYDAEADVLYISLRRPQRSTDSEYLDEEGIVLRYRGDDLVGITVLDASKRTRAQGTQE